MHLPQLTELLMSLEPQDLSPTEFYATLYSHAIALFEFTSPDTPLSLFPPDSDPTNPALANDINLHALFLTVHLNGGYYLITSNNLWDTISSLLGPHHIRARPEHLEPLTSPKFPAVKGKYIKKVYERWLLGYEEVSTNIRRRHYNKILRGSKRGPAKLKPAHKKLRTTIRELTLAAADNLATGSGLVGREPQLSDSPEKDGNVIEPHEVREADAARPTFQALSSTLPFSRPVVDAVEAILSRNREDAERMAREVGRIKDNDSQEALGRFLWDEADEDEGIDEGPGYDAIIAMRKNKKDAKKVSAKAKSKRRRRSPTKMLQMGEIQEEEEEEEKEETEDEDFGSVPVLGGYFGNSLEALKYMNEFPKRFAAKIGRKVGWKEQDVAVWGEVTESENEFGGPNWVAYSSS